MELPAGADEHAGTNLRVRQTLSGQPRDLGLLAVSGSLAGPGGVRAGWAARSANASIPIASLISAGLCLAGGVLAAVTIRNPRPEGKPAQQLLHCALNAPASPAVPHR